MKRYLICGRYGTGDHSVIQQRSDERLLQLNLIDPHGKLNYGIGRALSDLVKLGIFPTEIGIDLLVLAIHVQVADTRVSRETDSQDSWSREIRLVVPVSDPEKWKSASNILTRMLNFLTGDYWKVSFRSRPDDFSVLVPEGSELLTGIPYDSLSLFSGGLDSLIGTVDLLESGGNPLLISHANEGAVSDAQEKCFQILKAHYVKNVFDRLRVWTNLSTIQSDDQNEKSTRGRSFLFFAIGIFTGSGFNKQFTLRVPENGLIALNIPLDQLRLGSHSTRTTHPFYIARWNELLHILQLEGNIENPYWNKTKGEMVSDCANQSLLTSLIPLSLSCSSPTKFKWKKIKAQHCGYCLPCLIRRAAIKKGFRDKTDTTKYTLDNLLERPLDPMKAEGKQIRSFQVAVKRLNENPDNAKFIIHKSGSLSDVPAEKIQELVNLYIRGMEEVATLLEGVKTEPK